MTGSCTDTTFRGRSLTHEDGLLHGPDPQLEERRRKPLLGALRRRRRPRRRRAQGHDGPVLGLERDQGDDEEERDQRDKRFLFFCFFRSSLLCFLSSCQLPTGAAAMPPPLLRSSTKRPQGASLSSAELLGDSERELATLEKSALAWQPLGLRQRPSTDREEAAIMNETTSTSRSSTSEAGEESAPSSSRRHRSRSAPRRPLLAHEYANNCDFDAKQHRGLRR